MNFQSSLESKGLVVKQCLIWVKNSFNFGRQDYKWQHEPCLYGYKEGAGHYFVPEYNHPTVIEDNLDLDKMKKEDMRVLLEKFLSAPTSVIHENKPLKNDLHPTMKPVTMCAGMIRNSCRKGEKVLDLFGGSGSTLIACEQLSRSCYMMEFDPKYVDVIVKRFVKFKGSAAGCKLIRNGVEQPLPKELSTF
jgi:DNA modification methylase